jgi:branched-chain amino acid transport system permease protein
VRKILLFALIAAAVIAPWIAGSRYVFHIATMTAIMIPMALSMNVMLKIGQLSMAQSAFMGMGAYAAALLTMRLGAPSVLAVLTGGIIASIFALVLGPIFLRIKGVYFVLLTFAFAQIVNLIFQEWTSLFGGNSGLYGMPKFEIFGTRLTHVQDYFLLGLFVAAFSYALTRLIEASEIGAIFESINENEMLARALGGNALAWRIAAFAFSAFLAGISGGIYAFYIGFLSPEAFGFGLSVDLIVMNVIGGVSSALGCVLGAILVVPLPELLREARQYQLLIYGVILIVFLMFLKNGLISLFDSRRRTA